MTVKIKLFRAVRGTVYLIKKKKAKTRLGRQPEISFIEKVKVMAGEKTDIIAMDAPSAPPCPPPLFTAMENSNYDGSSLTIMDQGNKDPETYVAVIHTYW